MTDISQFLTVQGHAFLVNDFFSLYFMCLFGHLYRKLPVLQVIDISRTHKIQDKTGPTNLR